MNEKIGIAELLAARNLGGTDSDKTGKTAGIGALWAIFVIILIFAVIWIMGGGGLLNGITKNTTVGGLLGDTPAEQEETLRFRIKDQIDAEMFRQKIVTQPDLKEAICCVNKSIHDSAIIVSQSANAYADKGDNRLEHVEKMDVCKLQQEINTLDCRKIDKEFKRVAFCADPTCPPLTATQNIDGPALITTLELILDKLGK